MVIHSGLVRLALAFALFLGALGLVVWRQSRSLELLRSLDGVREERALLETERSVLLGRIQRLESRARIVAAAAEIGLEIPTGNAIVVLPLGESGGYR